jgi:Cu/Ag efflux protein CusF
MMFKQINLRRLMPFSTFATVLLIVVGSSGIPRSTAQSSTETPKYFCGKGEVVSVDEDQSGVTLKHQRIEGFMEAMTMHFKTEDAEVAKGIKAGDFVRFTLKDTSERTRLIYIEKIEPPKRRKR